MIILLTFLSLWLGVSLSRNYIALGLLSLLYFIYVFIRFKKKIFLFTCGVFFFGTLSTILSPYLHINSNTQYGIVYKVSDNYFLLSNKIERFYCYEKDHPYEVGDILKIKGEIKEIDFTTLESSFDFESYLKNKGVYREINPSKISYKFKTPLRLNYLKKRFLSHFDDDTSITVGSILFSNSEDNELTNTISGLHLARLISASGLYFNAFLSVIIFLLSLKIKGEKRRLIALLILSPFILFNISRFTIIRLLVIYLLRHLNRYRWNHCFTGLELVSISGIGFLLINPFVGRIDSFIIGYLISIFIALYNKSFKRNKGIKGKLKMVGLIYLLFIPFELMYYHSLAPLSLILQFILSPLFIFFGVICLISMYGLPIYSLIGFINQRYETLFSYIDKMKFEIYAPGFNPLFAFLYYLFLFLVLYYASIGFKPIKRGLISFMSVCGFIYVLPIENYITNEVSFINVGQGDCTFIRMGNDCIFIDTGGLKYIDLASNSLIPFLKKKRIYDVDLVITTHNDFDHMGALSSLQKNFKVKQVMNNFTFKPFTFKGVKFTNYNLHINELEEDNEKTLVIGFSLLKHNFLITGDASTNNEKMMMNDFSYIPCDILKVGHHGSKTSTSVKFIEWLKPKTAIISVGKNNLYGHPHQEVINTLKAHNVKIRRTDIEGTITYKRYR